MSDKKEREFGGLYEFLDTKGSGKLIDGDFGAKFINDSQIAVSFNNKPYFVLDLEDRTTGDAIAIFHAQNGDILPNSKPAIILPSKNIKGIDGSEYKPIPFDLIIDSYDEGITETSFNNYNTFIETLRHLNQ